MTEVDTQILWDFFVVTRPPRVAETYAVSSSQKTSPTDHLSEGPATMPPDPDPGKMTVSQTVLAGRCVQPRRNLRPLGVQAPSGEEGGGRPTDRLIKCQRLICVCR